VLAGYAESRLMYEALTKACENKDLTREGLQAALRQLDGIDLDGLVAGTLNYGKLGQPPSREVYFSSVDPDAEGGLTSDGKPVVSDNAAAYEVPSS
jgi:hypothetical protein